MEEGRKQRATWVVGRNQAVVRRAGRASAIQWKQYSKKDPPITHEA